MKIINKQAESDLTFRDVPQGGIFIPRKGDPAKALYIKVPIFYTSNDGAFNIINLIDGTFEFCIDGAPVILFDVEMILN